MCACVYRHVYAYIYTHSNTNTYIHINVSEFKTSPQISMRGMMPGDQISCSMSPAENTLSFQVLHTEQLLDVCTRYLATKKNRTVCLILLIIFDTLDTLIFIFSFLFIYLFF